MISVSATFHWGVITTAIQRVCKSPCGGTTQGEAYEGHACKLHVGPHAAWGHRQLCGELGQTLTQGKGQKRAAKARSRPFAAAAFATCESRRATKRESEELLERSPREPHRPRAPAHYCGEMLHGMTEQAFQGAVMSRTLTKVDSIFRILNPQGVSKGAGKLVTS